MTDVARVVATHAALELIVRLRFITRSRTFTAEELAAVASPSVK
jgi:hypothetical protein